MSVGLRNGIYRQIAVVLICPNGAGYRALVAVRALLETSGSFHSFDVWLDALGIEERPALASHWHCKRLVTTMAHNEKEVTHRLLREGAVFRLQADGLDRTYQVEIGTLVCIRRSWRSCAYRGRGQFAKDLPRGQGA
jgi:hypothetical protein